MRNQTRPPRRRITRRFVCRSDARANTNEELTDGTTGSLKTEIMPFERNLLSSLGDERGRSLSRRSDVFCPRSANRNGSPPSRPDAGVFFVREKAGRQRGGDNGGVIYLDDFCGGNYGATTRDPVTTLPLLLFLLLLPMPLEEREEEREKERSPAGKWNARDATFRESRCCDRGNFR